MKVSLDLSDKLLEVRDQGFRPTCLAFAASEVHSIKHGLGAWLSPEYLYHRAGARMANWDYFCGLGFDKVLESLSEDGQPPEPICPYQDVTCAQVQPVDTHEEVVVCASKILEMRPSEIYERGQAGSLLVLGINLTSQFQAVIGAPYVIDFQNKPPEDGHAVVLSGLAQNEEGQRFFRIKNSWGRDWADSGHVWLSEQFLEKYLIATLEVA